MIAYILRRLAAAVPILIAASFIIFWLASVSADPVGNKFAGRNPPPPPQTVALERHRMHLDVGFWRQYWDWLFNLVVHGNFGPSIQSSTLNIGHELGKSAVVTLRLVAVAMFLSLVFAVITGVLSAYR